MDNLKQIKWCWDNKIYIYPKMVKDECRIEINYKGSKHLSPEHYYQTKKGKIDLYDKIDEYYEYYFNKRNE